MLYYSTSHQSSPVSLFQAVLKGLATDGGLYMPEKIPLMDRDFFESMHTKSLQDISYDVASAFLGDDVPLQVIRDLVDETLTFDIPLVQLEEHIWALELFHGPTMAFKDVGARFMSRLMSWLLRNENRKLKVVVATSGDTGSAVAAGFYNVEGIEVTVLFPKGKVSPLQQKQITTWGGNIRAIEVDGTFDDCQKMAKQVLSDKELNTSFLITSANSINIARLIPQSFYYFYAASRFPSTASPIVFSVPSGNFGNLTAGLMANAMGLKTGGFVAATNINDVVPQYAATGHFNPRPSLQTISNAMDVGNPSNFARMMEIFNNDYNDFCRNIYTCSFSDALTTEAIQTVLWEHSYLMDPHGAVAWLGARQYLQNTNQDARMVFLETAHPAKFEHTLGILMQQQSSLPQQLQQVVDKKEHFISLPNSFKSLKEVLLHTS